MTNNATQSNNPSLIQQTAEGTTTAINVGNSQDIDININSREIAFAEIRGYESYSTYLTASITNLIEAQLNSEKVIIVGGELKIDKFKVMMRIVQSIVQKQSQKNVSVRQWLRGSGLDFFGLVARFREEKRPGSIFVLDDIAPEDINHDLALLSEIAKKQNIYVIASTNTPPERWLVNETLRAAYWLDLQPKMFSEPDLLTTLQNALSSEKRFTNIPQRGEDPIFGRVTLRDVARQLKTPAAIDRFVSLLTAGSVSTSELVAIDIRTIKEETALRLVNQAGSELTTLNQWFSRDLNPRQQLIALGLWLLDGLYEDGFFGAFDQLAEHAWHRRDPSLVAIDYGDLIPMSPFYDVGTSGSQVIRNRFAESDPDHRYQMLAHIWKTHRRSITEALPVLQRLVIESVEFQASSKQPDLYGTYARRDRLRSVMSVTLSEITRLSFEATQGTLLALATHENPAVQLVAARALSRWHAINDAALVKRFWDVVNTWRSNTWVFEFLNALATGRAHAPAIYLRATIVLSLGSIIQYERPGKIDQRLADGLVDAANDHPFIQERVRLVIPWVIEQHAYPSYLLDSRDLGSLQAHSMMIISFLRKLLTSEALSKAISDSIAGLYQTSPRRAKELIDAWSGATASGKPAESQANPGVHEQMIGVLAMTYGRMDRAVVNGYTSVEIGDRLFALFKSPGAAHPYVHEKVLLSLTRFISYEYTRSDDLFNDLLAQLEKTNEWQPLVEEFTRIYLEQRAALTGGDSRIVINHRTYPAFRSLARPRTEVEGKLMQWLVGSRLNLQGFALLVLDQLTHAFDKPEQVALEKLQQQEDKELERQRREEEERQKAEAIQSAVEIQQSGLTERIKSMQKWFGGIRQRIRDNNHKRRLDDLATRAVKKVAETHSIDQGAYKDAVLAILERTLTIASSDIVTFKFTLQKITKLKDSTPTGHQIQADILSEILSTIVQIGETQVIQLRNGSFKQWVESL